MKWFTVTDSELWLSDPRSGVYTSTRTSSRDQVAPRHYKRKIEIDEHHPLKLHCLILQLDRSPSLFSALQTGLE